MLAGVNLMLINYDSRDVLSNKLLIYNYRVVIYAYRGFIRLATGG